MKTRHLEIILTLIRYEGAFLPIQQIATDYQCSEKTIRNDLDKIEEYLRDYHAHIIRKPSKGVSLSISTENRTALLKNIEKERFQSKEHVITNDEKQEILYGILMSEYSSLQVIANEYYVSVKTVRKTITELNSWLNKRNVFITSKQRIGLIVEGKEKDIRQSIIELNEFELSTHPLIQKDVFHDANQIEDIVLEQLKAYRLSITDESLHTLVLYILLTIKRVKKQCYVEIDEHMKSKIIHKREYELIATCMGKIEKYFVMKVPEEELTYIAIHLIGSKLSDKEAYPYPIDLAVKEQAESITSELSKRLAVLLLTSFQQDDKLIDGLKKHLYAVIQRLQYNLPLKNPLVADIKQMYPFMFDALVSVLSDMKKTLPYVLPEDEIAFLTLHFQASMERIKEWNKRNIKMVIVCHMGIGVSEILRSRIVSNLSNITIVGTLPHNELTQFLRHNQVDFIVSTMDIPIVRIPFLKVSPLFTEEDKAKLIKQLNNLTIQQEEDKNSLQDYVKEEFVYPHLQPMHRFSVVEKLATEMYELGIVEKNYIREALQRERIAATAIGGGIAIPHGNPNSVKKSTIVLATFKQPIDWGTEKVSIVFFLMLKKESSEKRRHLFHQLSRLAGNPLLVEQLREQKTPEAILQLLS